MQPLLIILTDRGALRAAWIRPYLPNRPPQFEWIRDLAFVRPRQHFVEQVTDLAGTYSAAESSGTKGAPGGAAPRRAPSAPSEIHWKIEADRRALSDLAHEITEVLHREKPETWALAVPADLHRQLLEQIPSGLRERLSLVLTKNLVRTEPAHLLQHFHVPLPEPPPDNQPRRELS
jgi:hypothetical protein